MIACDILAILVGLTPFAVIAIAVNWLGWKAEDPPCTFREYRRRCAKAEGAW